MLISLLTLIAERTANLDLHVTHETNNLLNELKQRYMRFRLRYEDMRQLRGEKAKSQDEIIEQLKSDSRDLFNRLRRAQESDGTSALKQRRGNQLDDDLH